MFRATLGEAECAHVRNGLALGVRRDGRLLQQQRGAQLSTSVIPHMDGSCSVDLGGTQVLVSLAVNVEETKNGEGQLRVHLDCVPTVAACYSQIIGVSDTRSQRNFLSHMSRTVSHIFGAEKASWEDHGVADAILDEGEEEEMKGACKANTSFPSSSLSLGHGFAFVIDADIQILQCDGGNIVSAACAALRGALRTVRLPHASLHETPNGVCPEVDKSKVFSQAVDWSCLPTVAVLLMHDSFYVCDPSLEEEIALNKRLYVASSECGRTSFVKFMCLGSRRAAGIAGITTTDLRSAVNDAVTFCEQLRRDEDVGGESN